jgi:hypothetical protein
MKKEITGNALVAQMVRDAIVNDPRTSGYTDGNLYERACLWYERANALVERRTDPSYARVALADTMAKFLCQHESAFGILDFWDGDVVSYLNADGETETGIVKSIHTCATIHGGGYAVVLLSTGKEMRVDWKALFHAKLPQEILDIAKAQLKASGICPFHK